MPYFETTRHVAYTPAQMFALVADIEKYPEFVPLCEALTVQSRKRSNGDELLIANMTVGYKAIRETFTSQVHLKTEKLKIGVKYIDGPFKYFRNDWSFETPVQGGCLIRFHIDYEFKSRMLAALMGAMFDRAFRKFSDAFEKRAERIYPPPTG